MKTLKHILTLSIFAILLTVPSSCMVLLEDGNHGKHKGWYKNTNNPHHPYSTNPGHHKKKKHNHKK